MLLLVRDEYGPPPLSTKMRRLPARRGLYIESGTEDVVAGVVHEIPAEVLLAHEQLYVPGEWEDARVCGDDSRSNETTAPCSSLEAVLRNRDWDFLAGNRAGEAARIRNYPFRTHSDRFERGGSPELPAFPNDFLGGDDERIEQRLSVHENGRVSIHRVSNWKVRRTSTNENNGHG